MIITLNDLIGAQEMRTNDILWNGAFVRRKVKADVVSGEEGWYLECQKG